MRCCVQGYLPPPPPRAAHRAPQGSGFRIQGSGFRVQGPGFGVQGSGLIVQGYLAHEKSAHRAPHPRQPASPRAQPRPCPRATHSPPAPAKPRAHTPTPGLTRASGVLRGCAAASRRPSRPPDGAEGGACPTGTRPQSPPWRRAARPPSRCCLPAAVQPAHSACERGVVMCAQRSEGERGCWRTRGGEAPC